MVSLIRHAVGLKQLSSLLGVVHRVDARAEEDVSDLSVVGAEADLTPDGCANGKDRNIANGAIDFLSVLVGSAMVRNGHFQSIPERSPIEKPMASFWWALAIASET